MNSRDRLQAIVNNKPVDRVGVTGWLHMPLVDRNMKDFVKATINFTEYCEWDLIKVMYNPYFMVEAFGGDVSFSKNPLVWDGRINRYPISNPADLLKLKPVNMKKGNIANIEIEGTKRIVEHFKGEVPVLATVFAPLTMVQELSSALTPCVTQGFMEHNPKQLHAALEIVTETMLNFTEELIKAGIDGIFFVTQFGTSDVITREQHAEFARKYELQLLESIKNKTWFNMLHIHYFKNLLFKEHLDYPVQAYNWEDKRGTDAERTSIKQARAMTDKVLIGGVEQFGDFYNRDNDREAIKEVLRQRLISSLKECGDKKFVFAPGCGLPVDVDRYVFTLMKEVVDEFDYSQLK